MSTTVICAHCCFLWLLGYLYTVFDLNLGVIVSLYARRLHIIILSHWFVKFSIFGLSLTILLIASVIK